MQSILKTHSDGVTKRKRRPASAKTLFSTLGTNVLVLLTQNKVFVNRFLAITEGQILDRTKRRSIFTASITETTTDAGPGGVLREKSGNESIYTEKATNVRQQSGQQKEESWQGTAKQEKGEKAENYVFALCFSRFALSLKPQSF